MTINIQVFWKRCNMKKILAIVLGFSLCIAGIPFMRNKEANAGILTEKVLLWQRSVDCIYWNDGAMEYGYKLMFLDDDFEDYWISNKPCPQHLLNFNPMALQTGTQVKVAKSVLNNGNYFIHCT